MGITNFGIVAYQVEEIFELLNLIISNGIFGLVYVNHQVIDRLMIMIVQRSYFGC